MFFPKMRILRLYLFLIFYVIMKQGTVKFFNESKGFGFIRSDDGQEIFVHVTGLIDKIKEGDKVSFDVVQGKKGLNAVNVKLQ